jgi:hypothetical protein
MRTHLPTTVFFCVQRRGQGCAVVPTQQVQRGSRVHRGVSCQVVPHRIQKCVGVHPVSTSTVRVPQNPDVWVLEQAVNGIMEPDKEAQGRDHTVSHTRKFYEHHELIRTEMVPWWQQPRWCCSGVCSALPGTVSQPAAGPHLMHPARPGPPQGQMGSSPGPDVVLAPHTPAHKHAQKDHRLTICPLNHWHRQPWHTDEPTPQR